MNDGKPWKWEYCYCEIGFPIEISVLKTSCSLFGFQNIEYLVKIYLDDVFMSPNAIRLVGDFGPSISI